MKFRPMNIEATLHKGEPKNLVCPVTGNQSILYDGMYEVKTERGHIYPQTAEVLERTYIEADQ